MRRKHIYNAIGLLILLTTGSRLYAQQEPQYTQYMYNIGSFNPAYSSTVENIEITPLYRAQWLDIEGAPRTLRAGANIPFSNGRNGMSINVIYDEVGPASQTFFDVGYSFQINLSEDTRLSFGIEGGASVLNIDFASGNFQNPNEPLLGQMQTNNFYPTVGAGLFLYEEDWYLGLSVPNLLGGELYDEEVTSIIQEEFQYNFIGGMVLGVSENLLFKPAFLMNYTKGSPLNVNLSANALVNQRFTMGISYRFDNAVSGLAGFQISNGVFAGYSYDHIINNLSSFANGSHELIFKFYLGREGSGNSRSGRVRKSKGKPKQIDSPRFF